MKKIISLSIVALIAFSFKSADCNSLIFFKEGTQTTMTSYNDDGKVTGSSKTVYTKVVNSAGSTAVTASQETFDKKGKPSTKSDYTIKCEKGTLYFDMKMVLPQQQADSYKDFEMTVEGADKEFPTNFVVGSTLKDANIKFMFKSKDGMEMPMMTTSVKITNRKIEAKESVTTPAGTFECYKITEDVEMKTMFAIRAKSITWFNYEAGTVKTESYKENGKYTGKTELTELKK
jgi:hypothetical protein